MFLSILVNKFYSTNHRIQFFLDSFECWLPNTQYLLLIPTISDNGFIQRPQNAWIHFKHNFCKFPLFGEWTAVLFPAGTVSNTIQTGRLLPALVIKGQRCVMVI